MCDAQTSDIQALENQRQNKHKGKCCVTKKEKISPPLMFNPNNSQHSIGCCEIDPNCERPHIYTKEERKLNGIHAEWNKGCFEEFNILLLQPMI